MTDLEDACEAKGVTLVIHPVVRKALKGFEESLYIGASCFLRGETNGLYYLPLQGDGYVVLLLTQRTSPTGRQILRIEPVAQDGLDRIRNALKRNESARP